MKKRSNDDFSSDRETHEINEMGRPIFFTSVWVLVAGVRRAYHKTYSRRVGRAKRNPPGWADSFVFFFRLFRLFRGRKRMGLESASFGGSRFA